MSDRVQALPRLATSVWVAALLRRTHARGAFGTIVRKGDAESGAVILLQRARDGGTTAWARVAQGGASIWATAAQSPPHNTASVDDYLARQECYDPDLWIVELVIDEIQLLVAEPSQIR